MVAKTKKPTPPKESEIQRDILNALGTQIKEQKTDKRGVVSNRGIGIYIGEQSMFWRQNSGCANTATGGFLRYGTPGAADLCGVYRSIPIAFEVKRPGAKQRSDQVRWQEWFAAAGGVYRVVHSVAEALAVIEELSHV